MLLNQEKITDNKWKSSMDQNNIVNNTLEEVRNEKFLKLLEGYNYIDHTKKRFKSQMSTKYE